VLGPAGLAEPEVRDTLDEGDTVRELLLTFPTGDGSFFHL